MGELGLNKIFGALLAVALVIMGLREVSLIVFGGGHYHHHEYESLNQWAEENFKGYRVDIAETGGGGEVVEEIYDLGALLVSADLARGERSFRAKCASCHTIEEGGSNGTGPNLYAIMGETKQHLSAFSYSGALGNTDGVWSWENMDAWLENPSAYARGTSMAFAGLKRDDERASVLAYLASYSPDAPAAPEPLPAVDPEGDAEEAAGELVESDETVVEGEVSDAVEDAATEAETTVEAVVEDAGVADAVTEATETVEDVIDETVEDATEIVEDVTEVVEAPAETIEEVTTPEE